MSDGYRAAEDAPVTTPARRTALRHRIGSPLYRDDRERFLRVTDRIIQTTSRYMLGNLAISLVAGPFRRDRADPRRAVPARPGGDRGDPDLIPNVGATIAGIIVALVALSVSLEALIAFGMVMVVYQQVENYILQPVGVGNARRYRLHGARPPPGLGAIISPSGAADQACHRGGSPRSVEGGPVRIQDAIAARRAAVIGLAERSEHGRRTARSRAFAP